MGVNVPIVSFSGGEIGKETQARVDLDLYPTTADVMENCLPTMRGSLVKAAGTEFVGQLLNSAGETPLDAVIRPFIFNIDETRVLEFIANEICVVDGNEYVTLIGGTATIGALVDDSDGTSTAAGTTFTNAGDGDAKAYWEITGGQNGVATTFEFVSEWRDIKFSVGTTNANQDILGEITLGPGRHIISIEPTATTYYLRARLTKRGSARLTNLARRAAGRLTIATPYPAGLIRSLRFEQSNDVVWIYHPDRQTRMLERRGDISWSLRLYRPTTGPFEVMNVGDETLTPSALTGTITIGASDDMFTADSVGQLVQIEHNGQTETVSATGVSQASEAIRVIGIEGNRSFSVEISGTFVGTITLQQSFGNTVDWLDHTSYTAPGTHQINDELDNQIVYYRLYCEAYTSGTIEGQLTFAGGSTVGRAEITGYNSATNVDAEVFEPFGKTSASARWNFGSWSDEDGWPAAGQIADSRHWLVRDDRVWASVADDYENHLIGVDPSDAIARSIGTGDINAARWIELGNRIIVGTAGSEIEIRSTEFDEQITSLNLKGRPFGDDGAADSQAVRAAGKRVVYIDRTRTKLLQAYFAGDSAATESDNLTRLHETLAGEIEQDSGEGFVELAFQRAPEPRIWAVRSDGQLAVMLYAPKEGVYAWARVRAANAGAEACRFISVCVVPGAPEDRVHVLVDRGEYGFCHERFALNRFTIVVDDDGKRTAPTAWRLQCALAFDIDPSDQTDETTTISGLDHLEEATVSVWADGRYAGSHVVSGGEITIDQVADYAIVGLNYVSRWKSAKLSFGAQNGTALTQNKSVGPLGICIHDTPIGAVKYGRSFAAIEDAQRGDEVGTEEFTDGMIMDSPISLVTEDFNQPFEGETNIDSRVCLVMDTPAPSTILALIPNVELEEQV